MDNMDFRKWLTEYGYTYEEYQQMGEEEKKKIDKRFKTESKAGTLTAMANGAQGCGCLLILLPVFAILMFLLFNMIF